MSQPVVNFDTQLEYISKLYNNEITIPELKTVSHEIIQKAYEYLIEVQSYPNREQGIASIKKQLEEGIANIKKQLKVNIKDTKEPTPKNDVITTEEQTIRVEENKKLISKLFLDFFYDCFIVYKNKWSKMKEDNKKKKDYFRYLEEKLSNIKGIATFTPGSGLNFKKLTEMSNDEKTKTQQVIQNSFIDEDDNFVVPALYADTYEIDAYQRYVNEITHPEGYAGGSKKIYRQIPRKSATKRLRRRRSNRRTSRK